MCGICGVVQLGGEARQVVSAEMLIRMTDVMTHRGPDDRGVHAAPGVALGARRLSIVDVEGGHQPFSNEDGSIWAIQNGELYNHLDVRRSLEHDGHRLASRCDTEVLPHLYEQHGDRYPEHLRGMFATAVWDARRRRIVVARDRLGVKPLYWTARGDLLVFASELKSIVASGLVDGSLDYEAIDAFLTLGFFPAPSTPLLGVRKLMPGHVLVGDADGATTEAYWHYPEPSPVDLSEREYAELLLHELEESVRMRLMSDVPLGAMLSGGLDSSVIVGLMARNMHEPVKTFSVAFADAGAANELAEARLVADAFGTDHHELELSRDEVEIDLAELIWALDEPLADLSSLGFLALSQLAARHVTVALSGQGADELFGGYPRHRSAARVARWSRLPRPARALGEAALARGTRATRRAATVLAAPDPVARYEAQQQAVTQRMRADLYRGALAETTATAARRAVAAALGRAEGSPLDMSLRLDAQLALPDDMLHYFDRTSMAHSLEVRVPFLDHRFVELAARVPAALKVRNGTTKYILKRAARGLVPDAVIDKPKVGFFHNAIGEWLRARLAAGIVDDILGPESQTRDLLDPGAVERLADAVAAGRASRVEERLLLSIVLLELWLSEYLPRARAAGAADGRLVAAS